MKYLKYFENMNRSFWWRRLGRKG